MGRGGDGGRSGDAGRAEALVVDGNHVSAVVQACVAGLGFGRPLSYQVEPEVRAGALKVVLAAFEPAPLPVQIVYPSTRLPSARLRAFVGFIKEHLRSTSRRPGPLGGIEASACLPVTAGGKTSKGRSGRGSGGKR